MYEFLNFLATTSRSTGYTSTYSTDLSTLSTVSSALSSVASMIYSFIYLGIAIVQIIAMYKIFEKAGIEGWKAIIPIYNIVVLYKLVGLNPYLVLTLLIPCVGPFVLLIINYIAYYRLALAFGKDTGYWFNVFNTYFCMYSWIWKSGISRCTRNIKIVLF